MLHLQVLKAFQVLKQLLWNLIVGGILDNQLGQLPGQATIGQDGTEIGVVDI